MPRPSNPPPRTIGELLHRSYTSLAMAHVAVEKGHRRFGAIHFGIRKRLLNGLTDGSMNIGSLARDERRKMTLPRVCCYCGHPDGLTIDHLWPSFRGGADSGDNLVWACKSCNSSKGAKDLMEWMQQRGEFPPLLVLRRHLKLAIQHCETHQLMDTAIGDAPADLPFSLSHLPTSYPSPRHLALWKGPGGAPLQEGRDAGKQAYDVAKAGVAAKRSGNLDRAIELTREALRLERQSNDKPNYEWILRLAMYLQAAGRPDESWQELEALHQHFAQKQASPSVWIVLSRIEDKQRLVLQREGRHVEAITPGIQSLLSHACATRELGSRPDFEQIATREAITKQVAPLLDRAGRPDALDDIVDLVTAHLARIPRRDPGEIALEVTTILQTPHRP